MRMWSELVEITHFPSLLIYSGLSLKGKCKCLFRLSYCKCGDKIWTAYDHIVDCKDTLLHVTVAFFEEN